MNIKKIPLTLYNVDYTCSENTKLTEIDFLVLQAIKNKVGSLHELEKFFALPQRMIMEIIIGLIEYGYVGLASLQQGGFIVTGLGKKINHANQMSSIAEMESHYIKVVRENITGMITILKHSTLSYYENKDTTGEILSAKIKVPPAPTLIKRVIQEYLQQQKKHFHQILSITQIKDRIHTDVIINSSDKIESPKQWCNNSTLARILLGRIPIYTINSESNNIGTESTTYKPQLLKNFDFQKDILWDTTEHIKCLNKALDDAYSHLLIVSAHAKLSVLKEMREKLLYTIKRGVHIDIVIGIKMDNQTDEDHIDKLLKEIINTARYNSYMGSIELHKEFDSSDIKLLIYDTTMKQYEVTIGSYNWLYEPTSSSLSKNQIDISVILRDPQVVADIAGNMAGWYSGLSQRWQNIINTDIEPLAKSPQEDHKTGIDYSLVVDQDNALKFQDMQYYAKERLLTCSYKIGLATIGTDDDNDKGRILYLNGKPKNFQSFFYYDKVTDKDKWGEEQEKTLRNRVSGKSTIIEQKKGLHARVVIADDLVLISSFNFLSAGKNSNKHLGIQFKDGSIADMFWQRLV